MSNIFGGLKKSDPKLMYRTGHKFWKNFKILKTNCVYFKHKESARTAK